MPQLQDEIDANHAAFFKDWTRQARLNWKALESDKAYINSYRRLTALQAIKTSLVLSRYSKESAAFFFEAHNDALVSHVNASVGAWRSALQALRSCIENALCAAYYSDHPIELELWSKGKFRIGFSELHSYFEKHPRLAGLGTTSGLEMLKSEYATLSKAVHASAANFRMTDKAANVLLWDAQVSKASMWSTREKFAIEGLVLLFVCLHHANLQGTLNTPLRNVLYFALSSTNRASLKSKVGVTVPTP